MRFFVAVVAALQLASFASSKSTAAPKYTVNLDLPPEQRWNAIMADYAEPVRNLLSALKKTMPQDLLEAVALLAEDVSAFFPSPYDQEMVGLADALKPKGVTLADVLLGNVVYELTAYGPSASKACTSIVGERLDGRIVHGRNLDYSFQGYLRNVTVTVEFQRRGEVVYTGTTFAGMVGLLTGQKPHGFTISLDERDEGRLWMNILSAMITWGRGVSTFLIRTALDNDNFDYNKALSFLTNEPFIAPCYVIVGGVNSSQGAVVTRGRLEPANVWKLDAEEGVWFLVETNYDNWVTPPSSDDRRDPAIQSMKALGRGNLSETNLFNVLSIPPVLNSGTTYTVVMSAGNPDAYNTWIRT